MTTTNTSEPDYDGGERTPVDRLRACERRSSTADEAAGGVSKGRRLSLKDGILGNVVFMSTDEREAAKPASGSRSSARDVELSLIHI